MRLRHAVVLILLVACNGSSTAPHADAVIDGRWAGDNACLDLRHTSTSTLRVGCGHGEFPALNIRSDGTFDVDGTYRIEIGPVSQDPAPPAHYSGTLKDSRLTVTVTPSVSTLPAATYRLTYNPNATCGPACL